MSDDCITNPHALAHVKRWPTQMGIPLETRVAHICANWDGWGRINLGDSSSFAPGRVLYGDPASETPLREVDQGIAFQTYVPFTNEVDISLTLHVVIE